MKKFLHSFVYAYSGIRSAIRQEQNMRFHLAVAFYVVFFGRFYGFSILEKCILTLCIVGVLALEVINSSIERAVDKPTPDKFHIIGEVKDMAAGAVLIFSIGAALCGAMLFWQPVVLHQIGAYYLHAPWRIAMLGLSLAVAVVFVFRPGQRR